MQTETITGVEVGVLKAFVPFAIAIGSIDDNAVVYLDSELRVRLKPFADAQPIFEGGVPGWPEFCQSQLFATSKQPTSAGQYQLHKWNKDFHWRETRPDRRMLSHKQAALFDQQGWIVLPAAVNPNVVRLLEEEADQFEAMGEQKLRQMRSGQNFIARADEITFTTHLVRKSNLFTDFYRMQLFRGVCHDLIGDDVRLYWDQAVYKKPGVKKSFPWHQDNGYTFVEPQQYLTFWTALTHSNQDNGCMWLVPDFHRIGTIKHELTDVGYDCFLGGVDSAIAVPAAPGDIIVMSSLTPHQTGSNITETPRKALVAQFTPSNAVARTEDAWGQVVNTPANDPVRQFEILRGGEPVI